MTFKFMFGVKLMIIGWLIGIICGFMLAKKILRPIYIEKKINNVEFKPEEMVFKINHRTGKFDIAYK